MPRVIQPTFHGFSSQVFPEQLTIEQKFGNHTLVFLDYEINSLARYVMPEDGTLVDILWGLSPTGMRHQYGYVNHYQTVSRDAQIHTRLVILGTSKALNTVRPTNWTGTTRSGVFREIARRNRLRSVVHPHDDVLENWTTGIRTDFQSLQCLSDETGWQMWVDGSTAYFLDPERLLQTAHTLSTPTFAGKDVRKATLVGGSGAPTGGAPQTRKAIYGLDIRTNEPFSVMQGDPLLPVRVLPATAGTYSEGSRYVEASERKSSAFFEAKFILKGNATVYPGCLIRIDHPRSDLSGYWSVQEATHSLTRNDFSTEVTALRKKDGTPNIVSYSTLQGSPGIVDAVTRDGKTWEAALQEHFNA